MDKLPVRADIVRGQQTDKLVEMLGVISAQIEAALHETNTPMNALVETAHAMTKATQTVARCVFDFSGSPARVFQDLMVLHDEMHAGGAKAATAVQFHDRLVQYLTHVCSSLSYLAEFVASDSGSKSDAEWEALRERIRRIHSMEQERVLFDLLSSGASAAEKQAAVEQHREASSGVGEVELF